MAAEISSRKAVMEDMQIYEVVVHFRDYCVF